MAVMSAIYEHPSLSLPVTDEQRDRAEHWLQEAYADGRITSEEFDHRIGQVLGASTRKELNGAFYGLVQVPASSQALGMHPAYRPLVPPQAKQQAGRGIAGFAHFSALLTSIFGPLLIFALSPQESYPRKEAAKAFNFQLVALASWIVLLILQGVTDFGIFNFLIGIAFIGWVVLTVVGGAKALQGDDWTNPVKKVVKIEALSER
ncbi:hypothetical protein MLP_32830 [Microlunatus phosphovorus NM-1]|uniref:DUF1707 domain-containing protein n=2 Tax=Microlunatus phosphovorus TaxID=29405 RepID=F5XLN1_MICPN|nr:hypothetical protein MLP_32830 [Microlunatus phosphovorus NM-1]